MLVELPSHKGGQNGRVVIEDAGSPFEAALRRDLASGPVFAFEQAVGGAGKRAIDLALAILTLPLWCAAGLALGLHAKLRHAAPVLSQTRCVGYSGHSFNCYRLRVAPPSAQVVRLHASEEVIAPPGSARFTWRDLAECLPQMINVLRGEMSIVGPLPLSRDEVEELKGAMKHYLSARPGIFGIGDLGPAPDSTQYKVYAMSWSLEGDVQIVRDMVNAISARAS
ncbi:MAG: sugar transferase [Terricaulis sp.]